MGPENIWLAGRLQEREALGRIIDAIDGTDSSDGQRQAIRGAGVTARTDTIATNPKIRS